MSRYQAAVRTEDLKEFIGHIVAIGLPTGEAKFGPLKWVANDIASIQGDFCCFDTGYVYLPTATGFKTFGRFDGYFTDEEWGAGFVTEEDFMERFCDLNK